MWSFFLVPQWNQWGWPDVHRELLELLRPSWTESNDPLPWTANWSQHTMVTMLSDQSLISILTQWQAAKELEPLVDRTADWSPSRSSGTCTCFKPSKLTVFFGLFLLANTVAMFQGWLIIGRTFSASYNLWSYFCDNKLPLRTELVYCRFKELVTWLIN